MTWRQTTLSWQFHPPQDSRDANYSGTSFSNPIDLTESDDEDEHTELNNEGGTAEHPILISDTDGDDQPSRESEEQLYRRRGDESFPRFVPSDWPPLIKYWNHNKNPARVQFMNMDLGRCTCSLSCSPVHCGNAASATYCDSASTNCNVRGDCGNRLFDFGSLEIMRCIKGYGVKTKSPIPAQSVIGEYCGEIVPNSTITKQRIDRGFVLQFKSRSTNGEHVFIDAAPGGSVCRTERKMVVVALKDIHTDEEITVKYNSNVDFTCLCGAPNCITLRRQRR